MKLLMTTLSIILLTACASQGPYRPASGSGFGYKETALSDNHYRIHFKLRGEDANKGKDLALLRAAEVTLFQGYDWFEIVERETMVEKDKRPKASMGMGQSTRVTRDCGLLGCTTRTEPVRDYHMGVQVGADGDTVERSLEIIMGRGVRPENRVTYSARELRDSLRKIYKLDS
jgi:hypothetical protein